MWTSSMMIPAKFWQYTSEESIFHHFSLSSKDSGQPNTSWHLLWRMLAWSPSCIAVTPSFQASLIWSSMRAIGGETAITMGFWILPIFCYKSQMINQTLAKASWWAKTSFPLRKASSAVLCSSFEDKMLSSSDKTAAVVASMLGSTTTSIVFKLSHFYHNQTAPSKSSKDADWFAHLEDGESVFYELFPRWKRGIHPIGCMQHFIWQAR